MSEDISEVVDPLTGVKDVEMQLKDNDEEELKSKAPATLTREVLVAQDKNKAKRLVSMSMIQVVTETGNNALHLDAAAALADRRSTAARRRSSVRSPSLKKGETIAETSGLLEKENNQEEDPLTWKEKILLTVTSRGFIYFTMWVIWLVVGTIFYCIQLNLTISKGFYQSVNVGYSVGWGDIAEIHEGTQIFSTIYVCLGASFVGAGLGFFAEGVVADVDNWYVNAQQGALYDLRQERTKSGIMKIVYWFAYHWEKVRAILLWMLFIIVGTAFACSLNDWPFITGLYFATSSLSTGGLVALPSDAEDYMYGLLGLYGAIGIPLMALAMGTLAAFFINGGSDIEQTYNDIKAPITDEELEILRDLDLVDDDGQLDRLEFIILCMVRTGTDPALIHGIKQYFDEIDSDKSGSLSLDELHKAAKRKNEKNAMQDIKKIHSLGVKVENFHHPVVNWMANIFSYNQSGEANEKSEKSEKSES